MKLEVGKTYVDHLGKRYTIARINEHGHAVTTTGNSRWHAATGKCFSDGSFCKYDVFAEVPPEVHVIEPAPAVPHADLIRAALDGKTVQWSPHINVEWQDYTSAADAIEDLVKAPGDNRYRLKPELVEHWLVVNKDHIGTDVVWAGSMTRDEAAWAARAELKANGGDKDMAVILRLELDPDNLEVISARTEAP